MTEKQIKASLDALPRFADRTQEQNHIEKELRCREMINSIMIYGNINSPYNEVTDTFAHYLMEYVQSNNDFYHLGKERVLELIREQQADFAKAKVTRGAYTDFEGCTYNSCVWEDEQ